MNERLNDGRRKSIFHYTSLSLSGMITATFRGTAASQRPHSLSQSHSSLNGVRPRPPRHRLSPPLQLNRKTVGRSEESRTERANERATQHWIGSGAGAPAAAAAGRPRPAGWKEKDIGRTGLVAALPPSSQPRTQAQSARQDTRERELVAATSPPRSFLLALSALLLNWIGRTNANGRRHEGGRQGARTWCYC